MKAKKKEKERLKKEELKKAGKYLTPKQKEAARLAELRLQQMRDAGMIVAGLEGSDERRKPSFDKKKKKGKEPKGPTEEEKAAEAKKEEERLAAEKKAKEEEEAKRKAEEEAGTFSEPRNSPKLKTLTEATTAKAKSKDDADLLDSWEEALDENGNVKESWDQETEDEDEDEEEGAPKKSGIFSARNSSQTSLFTVT